MSTNFVPENSELLDYTHDQTVIVDGKYLNQLLKEKKEEPCVKDRPYWFPYANSYYQYGEDYDAVNRIEHLLHEKHSKLTLTDLDDDSSTESLFKSYTDDQYAEKNAVSKFLQTNPVGFIILGKPDIGEHQLGFLLAEHWNSILIHPELLIEEEILSGSRAGLCIEYNLRCGRAVSVDVMLRLLEKRLKSKSVQHRGFVICGFPLLPNCLLTPDPVSSESAIFNVHEIFEELFDAALDITTEAIKNVSFNSKASSEEIEEELVEEVTEVIDKRGDKISIDVGSTLNDVCYNSNEHADYEHQMEFIFRQISDHDYVIIYIKSDNEEVVNTRKSYRFDAQSMEIVNLNQEKTTEYSKFVDIFGDNLSMQKSKLLKLQRDIPAEVNEQLERYRYTSQKVIEKYILLHNPEFIVKLDGRTSPLRMFHVLKSRLRVLPISQSVLVKLILEPATTDVMVGEDYHPPPKINYDEMTPDEWFADLRVRNTAGKLFKWSLSDWGYYCPVAMVAGQHIQGKPKYAVQFLDKIYFLHDHDCLVEFSRNPRMYLKPPNPKPKCRVYVIGPPFSGKSLIADCIAYMLGGMILNSREMLTDYLVNKMQTALQEIEKTSNAEAINLLKIKRRETYETQEAIRVKRVENFLNELTEALLAYINCSNIINEFIGAKMTSLPVPSAIEKPDEIIENEAMIVRLKDFFRNLKLPIDNKAIDLYEVLLTDRKLLLDYLPEDIREPKVFTFDLISYQHPFVLDYVDTKLRDAKETYQVVRDTDALITCYKETIEAVEEEMKINPRTGWIVDGFEANIELFEGLYPDIQADLIFVLKDTSNGEYIQSRIETGTPDFDGFRQLFMDHGFDFSDTYRVSRAYRGIYDQDYIDVGEYKEELNNFENGIESVLNFMNEHSIPYNEIVFTNKSMNELIDEIINCIHVAFRAEAFILTQADREEEINDFGEPLVDDEELGGEGMDTDNDNGKFFAENRRLGDTGYYCPITYLNYGVLWKGKDEYAAKYMNKINFFCNAEALDTFIICPIKYIFKLPPTTIPPPRICITGVKSIGKTTLAKALAHRLGLFYLDLEGMFKLQGGEDENILEAILSPYWFKDPMKSVGFVVDGFPRNQSDIEFMCKLKLIPEVVLELSCEYYALINRLLGKLLIEWELQMEHSKRIEETHQLQAMQQWELKRKRMKTQLINARKQERYELSDTEEEESLLSYNSVEEAEEMKHIEEILDKELPEPIFNIEWETYDLAAERLQNEIEKANPQQSDLYIEIKEKCESELIPYEIIDGSLEIIKAYDQAVRLVLPLRYRNTSFFERVYDVSIELAEKLLELGYYFLSRYGKTCPVQNYDKQNYFQLFIPLEARFQLYPMIHRHYIYFIAGPDNRKKFKEDVLKYLYQSDDYFPLPQLRLSVIGPPRCAKSTISERIQYEYGLKLITIGSAVRYVLQHLSHSILALKVDSSLRVGEELTNELTMRCVEALAFDARAVACGIVMDGFPNNIHEARELAKWNLVPHVVLDLQTNLDYIFEYMQQTHKPEYSKKFITYRYKDWNDSSDYFRELMNREYQNISTIQIEPSKWKNWTRTNEIIIQAVYEIKHYYRFRDKEIPLHVASMLVTPFEFICRKSGFSVYCPCCLHRNTTLTYGGEPPNRSGLLQYRHKYYWICSEHILQFINNCTPYIDPRVLQTIPSILPMRVHEIGDPSMIYCNGMCVICAQSHKPDRVESIGSEEFAVCYGEFIYLFESEKCLLEFMKSPHQFSSVKFNFGGTKFPEITISTLPTLGLLEQYGSSHLVKAVISANSTRPMVPGLNIATSAMICMGLYLKIHNPKTPEKYLVKYRECFEHLIEKKQNFRECLAEMKKFINPYIHYQEPYPPFELKMKESTPSAVSTTSFMKNIIDEIVDDIH